MMWLWLAVVVAFLVIVFTLGIRAAEAFGKSHPPERRSGADRRSGTDRRKPLHPDRPQREIWTEERRAAYRSEHGLPEPDPGDTSVWSPERRAAYRIAHGLPVDDESGGAFVERRVGDRRVGDRRKKPAMKPRLLVAVSALILLIVGVLAFAAGPIT